MASNVVARVAKFLVGKTDATFLGFVEPSEAVRGKGIKYLPLTKALLVADRAMRESNGGRAVDLTKGTVVPAVLFAAKDIAASAFLTGDGVESLRESHRVRAKAGRDALKHADSVRKIFGF